MAEQSGISFRNVRDRLGKQRVNRVERDIINEFLTALEEVEIRLQALEDAVFTEGGTE